MVNEISIKKAKDLKRKSMPVGMRFMQEKVAIGKLAENYNNMTNNYSKANEDNSNSRQS